jgi:hypothetical protein
MRPSLLALVVSIALFAAGNVPPILALDYTESVSGDFSNDRLAPSLWGSLTTGINHLIGTTDVNDTDYFTINIPSGHTFSGLKVVSYDSGGSGDETAFIGFQAGTVMTVPPTASSAAGLLGWSHFGPGVGNVGQEILGQMGAMGFGSTGFVPPLPSDNYTFWIQQNGAFDPVAYQFDFMVSATSSGIPGDYNNNGTVDAADYVVWRRGGPLQNEVDTPGTVNAADYDAWRTRFGNPGTGSGASIPEPNTGVLAMLWCLFVGTLRRGTLSSQRR